LPNGDVVLPKSPFLDYKFELQPHGLGQALRPGQHIPAAANNPLRVIPIIKVSSADQKAIQKFAASKGWLLVIIGAGYSPKALHHEKK
jgi:hypothetical protein